MLSNRERVFKSKYREYYIIIYVTLSIFLVTFLFVDYIHLWKTRVTYDVCDECEVELAFDYLYGAYDIDTHRDRYLEQYLWNDGYRGYVTYREEIGDSSYSFIAYAYDGETIYSKAVDRMHGYNQYLISLHDGVFDVKEQIPIFFVKYFLNVLFSLVFVMSGKYILINSFPINKHYLIDMALIMVMFSTQFLLNWVYPGINVFAALIMLVPKAIYDYCAHHRIKLIISDSLLLGIIYMVVFLR